MTKRTTLNRLKRLREMLEAEKQGGTWRVNPEGHPRPTIPPQTYLEGDYLASTARSNPHLLGEVRELVSYAGRERGGEHKEYNRQGDPENQNTF